MESASRIRVKLFLLLCNALLSHQTYQDTKRTLVYKWKTPELDFPSEQAKYEAIQQGKFVPTNVLILDADYHAPSGRYFVTSPLFRKGIPSTVWEVIGEEGILRPFPRWPKYNESSESLSCNGPHSVFRVTIDKCGLMWVLDAGQSITTFSFRLTCNPKLMVFDLNNGDREILRYKFPKTDFSERSTLTTFVIESYENDCSDSIAYITDERDHGLVVFDYAKKDSWRVEDPAFYPWPNRHLFIVNGIVYSVMAGLFGIALGPNEAERKIYFHGFSSVKESWMPVGVLKNKTASAMATVTGPSVVTSPGERAAQATVEVMTDDGILIYHLLPENSLVCWNSKTPFTLENQHTLERDDENFQYISGMKLKDNNLFITSCRYQNYLYGLENSTEYNYRVIVIEDVRRLIENTPCANAASSTPPSYLSNNVDNNIVSRFAAQPNAAYSYNGPVGETNSALNEAQYRVGSFDDFSQSAASYPAYPQTESNYGLQFLSQSYNPYPNAGADWNLRTL